MLRWKNLDLNNRVLTVAESKTEAGRGRPVPLTQHAWAALDLWASRFPDRKLEQFVFPACENGHTDPERPIANWRTAWRRLTNGIQCPACCELQTFGRELSQSGLQGRYSWTQESARRITLSRSQAHLCHEAARTRNAHCSCGSNPRVVCEHSGTDGEALRTHSAGGAKASSRRCRDYRNPIGCEPNCAPSWK